MFAILVKATIVAAITLAAVAISRRSRASVRHAILAAGFAVLLIMPATSLWAPAMQIRVARVAAAPPAPPIRAFGVPHPVRSVPPPTTDWLLLAYLVGMAIFLTPAAAGLWRLNRIRRCALPWMGGQNLADALARDAGIRNPVEVLLSRNLAGPIACGLRRSAIILPLEAEQWSEPDLTRAIMHELEHVRRSDWVTLCAARLVCAAYWFHPLMWMAWRRLGVEAERCCDDAVLQRSDAASYAEQLVELARRLSNSGAAPVPAMANASDLSTRVRAVLDARQQRGPAGRLAIGMACAAAVAALTVSAVRVVSAQDAPTSRFAASSRLVVQTVYVRGGNGDNIEGLSANDFTVFEDGAAQKIASFGFERLPEPRDGVSSYYTLGYYTKNPQTDGAFRRIQVICPKEPSAKIEFRQGYYAGKPGVEQRIGAFVSTPPAPGVTPPQLIYKREPEYTEEARKAKYQGTVTLYVEIDATGHVTQTRVLRALGLGLDEKAIEAVKQWKFRPAMKDGKAIPTSSEVQVDFRLL